MYCQNRGEHSGQKIYKIPNLNMAEIFATIILFGSLVGMGVILFRKIPLLVELPEIPARFNFKRTLLKLKEKIKIFNPLKYFFSEIFLQKILSKIRIITLKFESKIATYLQKLREKSQKKKTKENDNYWQELKKSTKK